MFTCCSRSLLMVNDETPMLYLPEPTPGMMSSNFADCHSAFSPNLPATALNRSTSNPMTVLPSVSRNSLGAYVESVPMRILPSALIAAGTFAASAESTAVEGVGPAVPDSLFFWPHAASGNASAATARTATATRRVRMMGLGVIIDYLPELLLTRVRLRHAEIGLLDRGVVQQIGTCTGLHDPARLQHVAPVRPRQRLLGVLLD